MRGDGVETASVGARDPEVVALIEALTAELAESGYTEDQSFGYSVEQLEAASVYLVGARCGGRLVGVGGVQVEGSVAELKRFYVVSEHRGSGVADAVLAALLARAGEQGVILVRLETGDQQHAAMAFYRRHGFVVIDRFGPYVDSATSVCMERVIS